LGIDSVWKFTNQPYLQPGVSSKTILEDSMNSAKKKKRKNNGKQHNSLSQLEQINLNKEY